MNFQKVNKCIENAKSRIEYKRNRMCAFTYIAYFSRRNDLSWEEEAYVREEVNKYIDENLESFFPADFTINGMTC